MATLICDFCGCPEPTWTFRADPSLSTIAGTIPLTVEDKGDGWAACYVCADLIRTNQRDMLRERSVAMFYPNNPEMKHAPEELIRFIVNHHQRGFWNTKLDNGIEELRPGRTEFGEQRTVCACETCINNCRHMPGMLLPSDLERMTRGVEDIEEWALKNLLASPGALARVKETGKIFRVHTLVPAIKPDGSCIHLTPDNRCDIHQIAPFGCAFFDCGSVPDGLSEMGVLAVLRAHAEGEVYGEIWRFLWENGKRQQAPEVLRDVMRKEAS